MKISRTSIMTISLLCASLGTAVLTGQAATTFIGSTVVGIDQAQRSITIHTREGQSWTLPVADPDLLKKEQVSKGDQVSIEIDLNDRVTKIIKLTGQPRSEQTQSQDDLKP